MSWISQQHQSKLISQPHPTPTTMSSTKAAATPAHSRSSFCCRLPFELEREICEIAAYNFPRCVPTLILIARRFKIWFEPEIYRIIRSGEGRVIPPLYTPLSLSDGDLINVLDSPRIRAFGHHVHHVLLQKRSALEIRRVLECCPNVSNLALWIIQGTCTDLIPILEKMPLRRFSFDPSYFFDNYSQNLSIPFDQPAFSNITHLEIINVSPSWSKWKQLALLPKLTHLALAGVVKQELIDRVLEECSTLEVFIMFYLTAIAMEFLAGELAFPQKDERVVLLQSVTDHLSHWEKGARGEEDFWIRGQIEKEHAIRSRKHRVASPFITTRKARQA